jgi:hypothetical protein
MDMSRQKPNMIVHFAGKASSCPERFSASHDRDAATHDRSSDFAACRVDRPLTAYATVRNRTDDSDLLQRSAAGGATETHIRAPHNLVSSRAKAKSRRV